MEDRRYCPHCCHKLPVSLFRQVKTTGRFQPYCKICTAEYKKERYAASPEVRAKAIEAAKRRVLAKAEEVKAYQDSYRESHREELRLAAIQYRVDGGDDLRAKQSERARTPEYRAVANARRQWRMENDPEFRFRVLRHSRKAARKFYNKHHASILEKCREAYWADPDRSRAKTRRSVSIWNQRHPEEASAIQTRRKAMRKGARAEGFDDNAHYVWMKEWQQERCYHCDADLGCFHRDHLVPVQRGGRHEQANLALSCGRCNCSKHANLLWKEWMPPLVYGTPLLLLSTPVPVVSTFAASERGRKDARAVIPTLRTEYPSGMILFDWEWRDRRLAVENMLAAREGRAEVVQARNTKVVDIGTETARDFLEQYHLQGFGSGTAYLGLVHKDELVGVTAWMERNGTIELNRMAFKGRVIGGFGKMFSAFREAFLPTGMAVVSFVDPRYADGHSYETVGFSPAGETALPVYYYVGPAGMFHRRLFTKNNMRQRFAIFDSTMTERDNAMMNGYYRLFGLSQKRFILRSSTA